MKAWEVVAYTYEADYHCIECTHRNFEGHEWVDREGNDIHPVFASDEGWWAESHECGTCRGLINEGEGA